MQRPKCPRAPKRPKKPVSHKKNLIKLGKRQGWTRDVSVAEFVESMKRLAAKKTGRDPNDIRLDELYFYNYNLRFAISDGTPNPKFDEEMRVYREEKLPKYKKAVERYEERMKVYRINKEVFEAWKLKQYEDELKNEMKTLQNALKKVEAERQALIDSKD